MIYKSEKRQRKQIKTAQTKARIKQNAIDIFCGTKMTKILLSLVCIYWSIILMKMNKFFRDCGPLCVCLYLECSISFSLFQLPSTLAKKKKWSCSLFASKFQVFFLSRFTMKCMWKDEMWKSFNRILYNLNEANVSHSRCVRWLALHLIKRKLFSPFAKCTTS